MPSFKINLRFLLPKDFLDKFYVVISGEFLKYFFLTLEKQHLKCKIKKFMIKYYLNSSFFSIYYF